MMFVFRKLTLFLAILITREAESSDKNPCDAANHVRFYEYGSRNPKCTNRTLLCDYNLEKNWYVAPKSIMTTVCPMFGSCGVDYPTWLQGGLPDLVDGIVNRTGCTVRLGNCCKDKVNIEVKNCSGYYVYNLKPLKQCSSAYCFESSLPCDNKPVHPMVPKTQQTTHSTTNKDKPNHRVDNGLLIGILSGVALLILMTGALLMFVMKSKSCQRVRNTVSSMEMPPSLPDEMPPAYETIAKNKEYTAANYR